MSLCSSVHRCVRTALRKETGRLRFIREQTRSFHRSFARRSLVLGIESSCDDTGAAVVDDTGKVLGEALHSQHLIHLNHGGIIPPIAKDLHLKYIQPVVNEALEKAGVSLCDLDAIATTVKPGMPMSLTVGMLHGKKLARESGKPFIPIHHMEAHALTVRMVEKVEYPFLVLLISGGHCLLSLVKGVDEFMLLGECVDDAPGEAFDKIARRMKLRNIPGYETLSGGRAIEKMAENGNPLGFQFPSVMSHNRNCNFSFAGLKRKAQQYIESEEEKYGIEADGVIPTIADLCASFQFAVARHLVRRIERAMVYLEVKEMLPEGPKSLVVSGGVACNQFIRGCVSQVCERYAYSLHCPPPKLCTDNGIMIAWNGMERWLAQKGIAQDLESVTVQNKCPLGVSLIEDVQNTNIKLSRPFRIKVRGEPEEVSERSS